MENLNDAERLPRPRYNRGMRFLDWWRRLPGFIRIPVALAILALATCAFLMPPGLGSRGSGGATGLLYAIGLILLFTGPTDAQKKGYHD